MPHFAVGAAVLLKIIMTCEDDRERQEKVAPPTVAPAKRS